VSSKADDDRRTPGNTADDLRQPASQTNRQSCKEVSTVTKGLFEANGRNFGHFQ